VDVADTKAPGPDSAAAGDTEEGREQKAAPGGAADSGTDGGGIGSGSGQHTATNGPDADNHSSQRSTLGHAARQPAAAQGTWGDSGRSAGPQAAAAGPAPSAQHPNHAMNGVADTPAARPQGSNMQGQPQGRDDRTGGNYEDSMAGANRGRSQGRPGSGAGGDGDTAPGTGHAASRGAQTGPTQGRGRRRLVAFLGGIDVCDGVIHRPQGYSHNSWRWAVLVACLSSLA